MRSIFSPSKPRSIHLTDKGKRAINVPVIVEIPLLNLPAYRDRRRCNMCGEFTKPGDFTDPPGGELGETCLLCFYEISGETVHE